MIAEPEYNHEKHGVVAVESGVEIDDAEPQRSYPAPARRGRHIDARTDPQQSMRAKVSESNPSQVTPQQKLKKLPTISIKSDS